MMVGAASGLARLSALRWAEKGGIVIAADCNQAGLDEVASQHRNIHPRLMDVSDIEQVKSVVEQTESEYGPLVRVDNAAAIFPTELAIKMQPETFHRVMQVNYGGMVNISLTSLPRMLDRNRGVLVNYCSIAGLIPYMHLAAYGASKSACITFTEILYHENRNRGVQIVCLCPPSVDTPMLKQAVSHPKVLRHGQPMQPSVVLDRLDRAIVRRRFWCLPSLQTRLLCQLRRHIPAATWSIDHLIEKI